jgi:hypothetical protein
MELVRAEMGMSTAESIAWSVSGLLSFIALIAWLHWEGPREDQKKDDPPQVPKERERQAENSRSIHTLDYLLN